MLEISNPSQVKTGHSEQIENQLKGTIQKKGRNNGAGNGSLGIFGKLLAGLVNKKTLKQGEGIPNGLSPPEAGKKKTNLFSLSGVKVTGETLKDGLSVTGENGKKEKGKNQGIDELYAQSLELSRMIPSEQKTQTVTLEQASLKIDLSKQVKEELQHKVPFNKKEMTEKNIQGEIQNTALKLKKEENSLKSEGLSGKDQIHADAKKAGKKKMSVELHDFRTHSGTEAVAVEERGLKGAEEIRNGAEKEIIVELRPAGEGSGKASETAQKVSGGESFEQLLARELRGDLSTEIVKQATIVLRDGGEGTIKLSLRPESLGKVKIHLEMAENKIQGHIFVDNEEALRAFEQEIKTLEQSFKDSGFEASLNAALDYQNEGQRWKEKEVEPFFSPRFADSYKESSTMETAAAYGFGVSTVNVLA